ncbi:MAG: sulfate transporter family-domain-containing protein [Podila humilis]|nr:MAG: sulfate transporter family-domain-containing protein [Podila humilis]
MASDSSRRLSSPGTSNERLSPSSNFHTAGSSATTSRASSLSGGGSGSVSTISDDAASASSLGGLNHVNDGAGGSTAQRRMSRVFIPDDLHKPRRFSAEMEPRSSNAPLIIPATALASSSGAASGSDSPLSTDSEIEDRESCWKPWIRRRVPIFGWLVSPGYSFQDLPDDLIAGITISTVVIPQSMAYAMLAPLPPVYGLYTSVVPILIYCVFGTSRHMHTGTFAITTLLLGQAVRGLMAKQDNSLYANADFSLTNTLLYNSAPPISSSITEGADDEQRFIGMILMLSLVVGCVQVIMSFLRVGGWASKHLLPDALVEGFNTAAVFHIGTSQLKHFLGIKNVPSAQGAFALLKSWIWIGTHFLSDTNWYTVGLGTIAIVFMLVLRNMERARKAKHDLEVQKREYLLVQQRQADSDEITRNHENRRQQERQYQKSSLGASRSSSHRAPELSYPNAPPQASAATSSISLRTVADPGDEITPTGGSVSFAPSARPFSDPEAVLAPSLSDGNQTIAPYERQVYVPIPDILLAVIVLTVVNVIFSLDKPQSEGGMGIDVIGEIPKGLPSVAFPPNFIVPGGAKEWMTMDFFTRYILPMVQSALLIAVVIYVMSFSIAKQFGKRYGYKVDADQEMFALGLASVGGSFFGGYACTGSLTRTAILSQSGGKTPLASMVGVVTVVLTLICLTWCFERVPNCVLAAIVLVALQSLVMQITEPLKLWRVGQRKACLIWSVTFLAVLVISVELGIAIGIAVVLLATFYSWIMRHSDSGLDPLLSSNHRRRSSASTHPRRRSTPELEGAASESLQSHDGTNVLGSIRGRPQGRGLRLSAGSLPTSLSSDPRRRFQTTRLWQKLASFFSTERR